MKKMGSKKDFIMKKQVGSVFFLFFQLCIFLSLNGCSQQPKQEETWIITDLLKPKSGVTILGEPEIIESPFGKAVLFDGVDDGILLDKMPLKGLMSYTLEMIIRFDSGGTKEQRVFHTGTMRKDRSLLEIRSNAETWFFDGMVETNNNWVVLMDSTLLHPLGEWYHVAFTVENGRQITYVNGVKELEGTVSFIPIMDGATSIGVRQNKISWFKGAIYSIRISEKVLSPRQFLYNSKFHNN